MVIYGVGIETKEKSVADHSNPAHLLRELGLLPQDLRTAERELERVVTKQFPWVNVATMDIQIGRVTDTIRSSRVVNPPRTAHLGGSWEIITRGAGLPFNWVIIQKNFGYPLIFDLNQTPTTDSRHGDTLYFPGTVFNEKDEPVNLQLYTLEGRLEGRPVDRSEPRFVPMMMAQDLDGKIKPLTTIHRQAMKRLGMEDVKFVSDILVQNRERVEHILATILEQIEVEDNVLFLNRLLKLVANRVVDKNGLVYDLPMSWRWDGYHIGDIVYPNIGAVVEALIKTFEVASNPDIHLSESLPSCLPVISKEMLIVLMAALDTDFYPGYESLKPVNPHLHWGAYQMAGAPPKYKGYFSGSVKAIGDIVLTLRAGDPEIPPIYYVLLPAAPFDLWPSEGDSQGQEIMAQLIQLVHQKTDKAKGKPNLIAEGVYEAVDEVLQATYDGWPDYLRDRFSGLVTPLSCSLPPSPEMVEPPEFGDLTFRQASMTVGALRDKFKHQ